MCDDPVRCFRPPLRLAISLTHYVRIACVTMPSSPVEITLRVNGSDARVIAQPQTPLLYVLRNDLGLNGPKYGCGLGECGACAVLVDDHAARSCVVPVGALAGKSVTTLEGLGTAAEPHPVQAAFIRHQAAQCGY